MMIGLLGMPSLAWIQQIPTADFFIFLLGYHDGYTYAPRVNYMNGELIENTDFNIKNSILSSKTGGLPGRAGQSTTGHSGCGCAAHEPGSRKAV
ncbi:MAG: hypothetical protein GXN93_05395 [Candidatus Diapherotrites archaeon]|nr:hypothetical protein [Candidatus Diapherotrites archaeon]